MADGLLLPPHSRRPARRLQRGDGRVQEHLVHRVGRRWPGQGGEERGLCSPVSRGAAPAGTNHPPDMPQIFWSRGVGETATAICHPANPPLGRPAAALLPRRPADPPAVAALLPEHAGPDLRRRQQRSRPHWRGAGRAPPHAQRGEGGRQHTHSRLQEQGGQHRTWGRAASLQGTAGSAAARRAHMEGAAAATSAAAWLGAAAPLCRGMGCSPQTGSAWARMRCRTNAAAHAEGAVPGAADCLRCRTRPLLPRPMLQGVHMQRGLHKQRSTKACTNPKQAGTLVEPATA